MKLKKCKQCNEYTLKEICAKCKTKTSDAHYKFLRVRDAPRSDVKFFKRN